MLLAFVVLLASLTPQCAAGGTEKQKDKPPARGKPNLTPPTQPAWIAGALGQPAANGSNTDAPADAEAGANTQLVVTNCNLNNGPGTGAAPPLPPSALAAAAATTAAGAEMQPAQFAHFAQFAAQLAAQFAAHIPAPMSAAAAKVQTTTAAPNNTAAAGKKKRKHKKSKRSKRKHSPSSSDSSSSDSDSSSEGFDSDLDTDWVTVTTENATGPSTSSGLTSKAFKHLTSTLPFKAPQFEASNQKHLARQATDLDELYTPYIQKALQEAGDAKSQAALTEAEAKKKLVEVTKLIAGAARVCHDRNRDLGMRGAAKQQGFSGLDVVKATRSHYGSTRHLEPSLKNSFKDAMSIAKHTKLLKKRSTTTATPARPSSYPQRPYNNYNNYNNQNYANRPRRGSRSPSPNRMNTGRYSCNGYDYKRQNNNDRSGGGGPGGFNPNNRRPTDYTAPPHGSAYATKTK